MPARSKKQQRFFGVVRSLQKGKNVKGASSKAKKVAKDISKKAAKAYASTPHKGLPTKKESFQKFYENTTYYNDTLHPSFWDNSVFDSSIRKSLLKIVDDFLKDDKFVKPSIIQDIQLTGSLVNYNYSEDSDIDVHILLDFKDINEDEELVKQALDSKRYLWNLNHNIILNGHEVELYFQDVHEPHTSSGLYSLKSGSWVKKPKFDVPEVDERDVTKKTEQYKREIQLLEDTLQETSEEKELSLINKRAKKLKERILNSRKKALSERGEFSIENLTFKNLRNEEYIKRLNEIIIESYDKMFTKSTLREEKKKGLKHWFKQRWVNIGAPKKDGEYQPCGRSNADKGKYPKCVPAKKAYSMSKSQKRSATTRKRRAEKKPRKGKSPNYVKTDK